MIERKDVLASMGVKLYYINAGLAVRMARIKANISIRELAKYSGLSPTMITKIEQGFNRPDPDSAQRICLKVRMDSQWKDFCFSEWCKLERATVADYEHAKDRKVLRALKVKP